MTLQLSFGSQLSALQFGVNEISSALTIYKAVGSFLSISTDSQIFSALETQYHLFARPLPDHLYDVRLQRKGTVLGSRQRRIPCNDMMPHDLELHSVTGIATFVILILRYVETSKDIIDYVTSLLKGELGGICGGELERHGATPANTSLPSSIRENLRTYVNGILDADADSEQHTDCMTWFSQLYSLAGKANLQLSFSKYSRLEHRRFLQYLFGHENCRSKPFHTLSMGPAMIALAAIANGANIALYVITDDNGTQKETVLPKNFTRGTCNEPLPVKLWLTTPSQSATLDMGGISGLSQEVNDESSSGRTIPIYGGDSEIAEIVAHQLSCNVEEDARLRLWKAGLAVGQQAKWEFVPQGSSTEIVLRLSPDFVRTERSQKLEPLLKNSYAGPMGDLRHDLARKAAVVYDDVFEYRSYDHIDAEGSQSAIDLVLVAFTVGCLKSLISNASSPRFPCYALVLEEPDIAGKGPSALLNFCEKLLSGHRLYELLYTVGTIWGGLSYHPGFPRGELVGIVCPEVTLLLDILYSPESVAEFGLARGIMSLHTGSVPILPRDPVYGAIMAGNPNPEQRYTKVEPAESQRVASTEAEIILTVEPYVESSSPLSAIICGWTSGDVTFEMNPFNVFQNLISKRRRNLRDANPDSHLPGPRMQQDQVQVNIPLEKLESLKYFKLERAIGIIDAGSRSGWKVAVAGSAFPGSVIMVMDEEDCQMVRERTLDMSKIPSDTCLVLC